MLVHSMATIQYKHILFIFGKINYMKITFQKIKINLRDLSTIFLLTSIMCCIDTILFYDDMMCL